MRTLRQLRIVRQHEIATESASKNHKDKRDLYTLHEADVNSGAFSYVQTVQDKDAAEDAVQQRENQLTSRNIPIFIFVYESESLVWIQTRIHLC